MVLESDLWTQDIFSPPIAMEAPSTLGPQLQTQPHARLGQQDHLLVRSHKGHFVSVPKTQSPSSLPQGHCSTL